MEGVSFHVVGLVKANLLYLTQVLGELNEKMLQKVEHIKIQSLLPKRDKILKIHYFRRKKERNSLYFFHFTDILICS